MRIYIGHIGIEITKLDFYTGFNPEGKNYTHRWEHADGLGYVEPNYGDGHTLEGTIKRAKKAVCGAFGWDVDTVEVIRPEKEKSEDKK